MSWIMILLITVGFPVAAIWAVILPSTWRQRRMPPELRGDWWPRFESEFRDYAERATKATGEARRRKQTENRRHEKPRRAD